MIDKWLKFSKMGGMIESLFLPFKVPLKESVNVTLQHGERFYFLEVLNKYPNIGLVVDLTKTTKYYHPGFLKNRGIQYAKIFMEGHGKVPPESQVQQFFKIVDSFREKEENKGKLIGVHCTHGCNRTGFLICRYLIEKMKKDPKTAVVTFEKARGHEIERPSYRNFLLSMKSSERKESKNDDKDDSSRQMVTPIEAFRQQLRLNEDDDVQILDQVRGFAFDRRPGQQDLRQKLNENRHQEIPKSRSTSGGRRRRSSSSNHTSLPVNHSNRKVGVRDHSGHSSGTNHRRRQHEEFEKIKSRTYYNSNYHRGHNSRRNNHPSSSHTSSSTASRSNNRYPVLNRNSRD